MLVAILLLQKRRAVPLSEPTNKILIVEDTAAARKLAVRMLSSLGYAVKEAEDAGEAIRILEGEDFDVLFTDIVMPGPANGIELARYVRLGHPDMHIVFTSGFSEMNSADLIELRATYVSKPYRIAEIARILQEVLA